MPPTHRAPPNPGAAVQTLVFVAALSITSGVMFARGGRLTRITTAGYGVMSALVGVPLLVGAAEAAFGFVLERAVLWIGFGSVISASVLVPSGTQWFSRPRG